MARFTGVTQGYAHIIAFGKPGLLKVGHVNFRDTTLGKRHEILKIYQVAKKVIVSISALESLQK